MQISITQQLKALNESYRGKCTNVSLANTLIALEHKQLTPTIKLVLVRLALFYNPSARGQGAHPTTEELARASSVSLSTAKKAVAVAGGLGILRWVKLKRAYSKDNAHNSYDFRPIDPRAESCWRGAGTKLSVVSEGNLPDPIHDGTVLNSVLKPMRRKPIAELPALTEEAIKAAVEASEGEAWRKKLDTWAKSDHDDWDRLRSDEARALIKLHATLSHTPEQAMANVNTLIKYGDKLPYPHGYEHNDWSNDARNLSEIEAICEHIVSKGYPHGDLAKFVPKWVIEEEAAKMSELDGW
jgi:hypothetical protein